MRYGLTNIEKATSKAERSVLYADIVDKGHPWFFMECLIMPSLGSNNTIKRLGSQRTKDPQTIITSHYFLKKEYTVTFCTKPTLKMS